ncbi:DUF2336 domain-containing protein [Maricaulis sp. CAU 1757]
MAVSTAEALHLLTKMRDPDQRHQMALGVTDLCTAQPLSPTADPIASELLITLSDRSEAETKLAMAKKLANCDWAPHTAIRHFAFQPIEIASVIIKSSDRLLDKHMVELAERGSPEHRLMLAGRPNICLAVTDVLAKPREANILRALASNDTAEISENTLSICLSVARAHPKLREALARRPDLSTEFATQLCIMMPDNWREELYRRFALDKGEVEKLTVQAALSAAPESADKEAAAKVQAAHEAGELSGKYALDALSGGDEVLFDHAIAHLCGIKVGQWRVALAMGGVRAAAMACQAAQLERTAYPIIHRALRRSGRMHQALEGDAMSAAANVFRMYGPEKAVKVLRQMGARG